MDGIRPDALENAFSKFENELAPALERIIAARSISNFSDRILLLNLAALLAVKQPRLRESVRDFHERVSKQMMQLALATPQRWATQIRKAREAGYITGDDVDYAQVKSFFDEGKYKIEVSTQRHLQLELNAFDKVLPYIVERKWILLRAPPKSTGFITSDHPICLMWSDPNERQNFNHPGLGLERTQLLFPISNELAMIGAFELEEAEYDATDLMMAQINATIIVYAQRQVYARDSDFHYKMAHNKKIRNGADLSNDWSVTHVGEEKE